MIGRLPGFGEVWVTHAEPIPGATYLVISGQDYNDNYYLRIVVEVIGDRLAQGHGGYLIDLGPIGYAAIHAPITVSLRSFEGSDEPVTVLEPQTAHNVAAGLRRLLGP